MNGKQRWPYKMAHRIAQGLFDELAPYCHRIEIAGSIRRQKPTVGDIELLCIPRPADSVFVYDALDARIKDLLTIGLLDLRRSARGTTTYGPLNKLLVHRPTGIPIDIFSAPAENWGMALFVRTGPAEWNIRAMAHLKTLGKAGHAYGGITLQDGSTLACPAEEDVFKALGWPYREPWERLP